MLLSNGVMGQTMDVVKKRTSSSTLAASRLMSRHSRLLSNVTADGMSGESNPLVHVLGTGMSSLFCQ